MAKIAGSGEETTLESPIMAQGAEDADTTPLANTLSSPAAGVPLPSIADKGAATDIDELGDIAGDEDELGPVPMAGIPPKPSFAQLLAKNADQLGIPSGPGGWAKTIVGAATQALGGGVAAGAAVGKVPEGAGGLYGAEKALQYQQQVRERQQERQDRLAQQARENARQDQEAEYREQKLAAQTRLVEGNIQKMHNERMAHQLQDKSASIDTQISTDAPVLDSLVGKGNPQPATVIARDIDSDEVQKLMQQNKINSFEHHAFVTKKLPIKDADGNITGYRGLYTLVGNAPKVTVGDQEAAYLNKFSDDKWDPTIQLDSDQLYLAHQRANNVDLLIQHINEDRNQLNMNLPELTAADIQKKSDVQPLAEALRVANYDPIIAKHYLDDIKKNPGEGVELQALYGGTKAWQKIIDDSGLVKSKTPEKMTMDESIAAATKQLTDAQAAFKDDPTNDDKHKAVIYAQDWLDNLNTEQEKEIKTKQEGKESKTGAWDTIPGDTSLSGQDYLNSIDDPAKRELVRELVSGRIPVDRPAYLLARDSNLMASAALASGGNFDGSKIGGYPTLVKDFTSGPESDTIEAANTFLPHLYTYYQHLQQADKMGLGGMLGPGGILQSAVSKMAPGTDAGKIAAQLKVDQENTTQELERTYTKYALSPQEKDHYMGMLQSVSPGEILNTIPEIASLVQRKFDSVQTKWNDGAPSDAFKPPRQILNNEARNSLTSILGDQSHFRPVGAVAPPSQNPPNAGAGATPQPWDARRWAQANPNGDVNAAIAFAKSKGYNVVNAPTAQPMQGATPQNP